MGPQPPFRHPPPTDFGAAASARNIRAVTETRYRIVFLLLGLALAAVIAASLFLFPEGRDVAQPGAIESVSPAPDQTVLRQVDLVIDMRVGYEIEIYVDGRPLPASEVTTTEATGVRTWRPGPGLTYEEWTPGIHAIQVTYERISGTADVGEFRWVFRVQ